MKYFVIAGEVSGDMHAGALVRELKSRDGQAEVAGMGGDCMEAAGCRLVQHCRNMAFMGVMAVVCSMGKVRRNFRIAEQALMEMKPDTLILIDYPSFNLRIAAFVRRHLPGTRIVWYIPPKVWAWKKWRIHRVARLTDLILGIFPFEPAFYESSGYSCLYVGNPTLDRVREAAVTSGAPATREDVIALLPGSRRSEITQCLPVMLAAARSVAAGLAAGEQAKPRIVVAAPPTMDDSVYAPFLQGEELTHDTLQLLRRARAAVVNSGTATLETALLGCPQTAVYHVTGSKVLGFLRPLIFSTPFFTLVNIIAGREVIQELVGPRFSRRNIEDELMRLLADNDYRRTMSAGYASVRTALETRDTVRSTAAAYAAECILGKNKV